MDAQKYALDQGLPGLFVAVDQEGGQVARLRKPFTEFLGNPHMKNLEDAREFARITASELTDMGINMNMAPVMDVVPPDVDSIMKDRAFTGDANRVSQLGTTVIQGLQKGGVMAVAKHFPGIGRTVKDSHFFLPELDAELSDLKQTDLVPFEAAKKGSGFRDYAVPYPLPQAGFTLAGQSVKDHCIRSIKNGYGIPGSCHDRRS